MAKDDKSKSVEHKETKKEERPQRTEKKTNETLDRMTKED